MTYNNLELSDPHNIIHLLESELATTNQEVMLVILELEKQLKQRAMKPSESGDGSQSNGPDTCEMIRVLQEELASTNREVMALTLELEKRVEQRTKELRDTQEELTRTNSELLQLTLELEERVAQRTQELAKANESLRAEISRRQDVEESLRKLNAELEKRVQERTVELLNSNKELESFAYSVSHDLRAPLRAINGWSQALEEDYGDRLDEQARVYLNTVRSESQRMGDLIDALLKLSRIARSEMRRENVDMSQVVRAVEKELRLMHPEQNVEFIVQPNCVAQGDPILLRLVLQNLIGNAWKFTSKSLHPRVEFGSIDQDGKEAYFVRDNGAGFDMAYASKLFTPFQRLHHADDFPGTGIGLATVHRIVGRHGGRVWAQGEPGKGATFYFTLGEKSRG